MVHSILSKAADIPHYRYADRYDLLIYDQTPVVLFDDVVAALYKLRNRLTSESAGDAFRVISIIVRSRALAYDVRGGCKIFHLNP